MRTLDAQLAIRMPGDLRGALEDACRESGYPITQFTRFLLEEALAARGNEWARERLRERRRAEELMAALERGETPEAGPARP